jgi:cytochrome c556
LRRFIALAVTAAAIAGCQQGAEQQPENESQSAATNNATATPEQRENAVASAGIPTTPVASRDVALKMMKARHESYEEIGDAMKLIGRELKGDSPDLAAVRAASATIAGLAPKIPSWFPPGTGPDVGKTEAKAEIWQKPEDFAVKAHAMNQATAAFNRTAQGTDVAAIRASHGDLAKTCKACHDLYREEH